MEPEQHETFEAGLRCFLAEQIGAADLRLSGVHRHIEGFSWETWDVTAEWPADGGPRRRRLIVRREPQAGLVGPYDVGAQWDLAQALQSIPGIPVSRPLWVDRDGDATGRPLYVMEHVAGDVPAPWNAHSYFADDAARQEVGRQLIDIVSAIHALDVDRLPGDLRGRDDPDPVAEVAHWERVYERDRAEPVPVLERAFGWLATRAGDVSGRRGLVHGDFRIGNAIIRDGRVVAMLDWELAHIGDPVEDLANFASRLYRGRRRIPSGLLTMDELLDAYEQAAGWQVPRRAMRYWLVFNDVRSAVSFLTAGRLFATGATRDLRYAAFSRQVPYLLRHVMTDLAGHD